MKDGKPLTTQEEKLQALIDLFTELVTSYN